MINIFKRKLKTDRQMEIEDIKKDIKECEFLLSRNDIIFNMAVDEKLIESKIYEREALLHQYDYLVTQLREKQKEAVTVE
ncbi:MAG: hypothetical protein RR846_00665 [Oscillospiraceae bacterium]